MHISHDGWAAFTTTQGDLWVLQQGHAPIHYNKAQARARYFEVSKEDCDSGDKDSILYVMGRPSAFPAFEHLEASVDGSPDVFKGEHCVVILYPSGHLLLAPLNPLDWVDVVQTRDTERLLSGTFERAESKGREVTNAFVHSK